MKISKNLSYTLLLYLGSLFSFAFAQYSATHSAACLAAPGVNLAYGEYRVGMVGDMSIVQKLPPEIVQSERALPGLDWLYFFNQNNLNQSFMYPPQWRPSIVPADPLAGDSGIRLESPAGNSIFESFFDGESVFTTRGNVTPEAMVSFALTRVLNGAPYEVLCFETAAPPALAASGVQAYFIGVTTASQYAVAILLSFPGSVEPSYYYTAYSGPKAEFSSLVNSIFMPVMDSFPKAGGGSCSCESGEPDRDNDRTCDRCDTYPDDPARQ